jgi:hypothetical protein
MKDKLEEILNDIEYPVISEYKFSSKRKFRFDYFIDLSNFNSLVPGIGIEYEGINYQNSNYSRHTNTSGFIKDIDKYNLALSLSVPVLRYTFKQLEEPEEVKKQIMTVISNFLNKAS